MRGPEEEALLQRRKTAADLSRGYSSPWIHRLFLEQVSGLHGDLLDFGAGQGHLAELVWRTGRFATVTAMDIMPRPASLSREIAWLQADLNERPPAQTQKFDVIVSSEVIEHLENPRLTARIWHELLRPQGRLICSTPNNESLRSLLALVTRGHFLEFGETGYPAHITALLALDLERILREAGFSQIQFHYSGQGAVPRLTRLTWQRLSGGWLRGRRFSDNVVVTAQREA